VARGKGLWAIRSELRWLREVFGGRSREISWQCGAGQDMPVKAGFLKLDLKTSL